MVSWRQIMMLSFEKALIAVVFTGLAVVPVSAQSGAAASDQTIDGVRVTVIHPKETPSPFPLEGHTERLHSLEFRTPEQMSAADAELVRANEGEIARRAGLAGLHGLGMGEESGASSGWGYEQAMCPQFPNHVVLEYSRDNGHGDYSLFSAVIPRGEGHVRVIPVERRSFTLFTPAPANALTVNDFNHIVNEERERGGGEGPDWLALGLCYAALAGGHVRAALVPLNAADETYPLYRPAMLEVSRKGGAEVSFADTSAVPVVQTWELSFAQDGRLLKARSHKARAEVETKVIGTAAEIQGAATKESAVDLH
jgi:hypothetical protein